MKLICIDYDVYPMWRFKPLYEIRDKKIEDILNG